MKSFSLLLLAAATVSVSAAAEAGQKQPAGAALRRMANSNDPGGEPSRNLDKRDSKDDGAADAAGDGHEMCGGYHYSPCCAGDGYEEKCMPGLTCVKFPPPIPPPPPHYPHGEADDAEVVPAGDYDYDYDHDYSHGMCLRCGQSKGDPCCEGHKCDIGKMLTCGFDGQCVICGSPPETVCVPVYTTDEEAGKCPEGSEVDASGKCCTPTTIFHPCCDGDCAAGYFVDTVPNGPTQPVATPQQGVPVAALVCNKSDQCQFCGTPGEQCCDPPGEACQPGQVCTGGICEPCGLLGSQCCAPPGDPCTDPDEPTTCQGNVCVQCGLPDHPCCDPPGSPCFASLPPVSDPLYCSSENMCRFCGSENLSCCDGMKCNTRQSVNVDCEDGDGSEACVVEPPLVCNIGGTCEPCGDLDQLCCSGMSDEAKCPGLGLNGHALCLKGGKGCVPCTAGEEVGCVPFPLFCNAYGICALREIRGYEQQGDDP